jgi:hypothetical protein
MDASLLEPIFACWPVIGHESYQLAGTGESWAKCESRAATRLDFLKNGKSLSKIGRPSSPWQSHLRDANAMIAG